ncbi:hypothetical protein CHLNCDRAFT_138234 [Chlorella variabilis]|uniref:ShKT domain-containing protein n=1 Tax=Chlorella variabilis TaxID=554065 RepID=E1Z3V9_CHLVA|nr:hypothetical protein CHLNCDRAFT_138234 [Chlorella variabilis]EFN59242.1 hypothetical protein CHLNCDRAFT_138234 [Chlorella variabilis]|eukprot:XP_005851344.1 hypothetical protein CHLNCDRAFT_138234 [Chlorella variabilis]
MFYSHRKSGQPGPITRIMCCTKEEYDKLPEADRDLVPTHVAPSYTRHPRNGDIYSAYNKPVAIIDWLAKNDVKEEYVLVIDADMIMREPFTPEEAGAKPGLAVAAYFGYMKGVKNALAMKHVPWVLPRNDTMAGPRGRRGDQVGGFTLMNVEDLRRVGPGWLKYTEDVRFDPDAWELTGDAYSTHKGDRPWISEMYGYSYGCAAADVWHNVHHTAMLYPGYEVVEPPKVLHYGLLWNVPGTDYSFDKHWHYSFDPLSCPPWEIGKSPRESRKGLFAHPPNARSFKTSGAALLRDLMSIEVPLTLNVAFCERHRKYCPSSEELERECGKAEALMKEFEEVYAMLELPDPCHDIESRCHEWAEMGECENNQGYMYENCALSCKRCTPRKGGKAALAAKAVKHKVQADNKPQRTKEDLVADSAARLRGGGSAVLDKQAAAEQTKQLRLKCTGHPDWSLDQVKDCLRLAAQGKEYKAAQGAVTGGADGRATAARTGGAAEQGQRQEQQLHEDKEVLQEQQAVEKEESAATVADVAIGDTIDTGSIGQAGSDRLLEEGLLDGDEGLAEEGLGAGKRGAVIKRIGEGTGSNSGGAMGAARLALFGVLLWAGSLVVACFLLPWARKAARRSTWGTGGGGQKGGGKGGRDD